MLIFALAALVLLILLAAVTSTAGQHPARRGSQKGIRRLASAERAAHLAKGGRFHG